MASEKEKRFIKEHLEMYHDTPTTIARVLTLRDMAEKDIFPDGSWGDDEVAVWETFRLLLFRAKNKG